MDRENLVWVRVRCCWASREGVQFLVSVGVSHVAHACDQGTVQPLAHGSSAQSKLKHEASHCLLHLDGNPNLCDFCVSLCETSFPPFYFVHKMVGYHLMWAA